MLFTRVKLFNSFKKIQVLIRFQILITELCKGRVIKLCNIETVLLLVFRFSTQGRKYAAHFSVVQGFSKGEHLKNCFI